MWAPEYSFVIGDLPSKKSFMKLKKNIATSEAGLIFNPGTGDSFSVNTAGTEILSKLKEGKSHDEIVQYLLTKFDIEKTQIEKDMDDFLSQLSDYNLLED
jgi:hypothetical protein